MLQDWRQQSPNRDIVFIFISGDRRKNDFESYCQRLQMYAVPYSKANVVTAAYNVESFPTLIFFDQRGVKLHRNGVSMVRQGINWIDKLPSTPAKPQTAVSKAAEVKPSALLAALPLSILSARGGTLSTNETLKGQRVCLVAYASWCPACV